MRDNLPTMLRASAKEWREKNKVVATGATRYDAALEEAADAIEELQKRVPKVPHGRLGDLDALKVKAIERSEKCGVCVNVLDKVITAYDIETAPTIIPAEDPKLSATIKCGDAVTCAVAHSEEVYKGYAKAMED